MRCALFPVFESLNQIAQHLKNIMSKVSEFVAKQEAHNAAVDASLDTIGTSVTGIVGDVAALNDLIRQLQESQGEITPEDQALLDQLEAKGQALEDRAKATSDAVKAADDLTPPPTPEPAPGS